MDYTQAIRTLRDHYLNGRLSRQEYIDRLNRIDREIRHLYWEVW